jgi:hypothetical protein
MPVLDQLAKKNILPEIKPVAFLPHMPGYFWNLTLDRQ